MKRLLLVVFIVVITAGLLGPGCSQGQQAPVPPGDTGAAGPKAAKPASRAGWEEKWDAVLTEAKKEGKLLVYTNWTPETRIALSQAFQKKFGIELDFLPFSRGAEIPAKVQTEQAAGLYLADAFGTGAPSLIASMKPVKALGPVEPMLTLPEVTDPKFWTDGKFPFVDRDRLVIGLIAAKQPMIVYNTNLVKKGEITGYKDLLKPAYKGKMTLTDPTLTGPSNSFLTHLAHDLWNVDEAREFLRQLVKVQETVVVRDYRLHMESVARGKYAIGLAPDTKSLSSFLTAGAPLDVVSVKEGAYITPSSGALGVPVRQAHPAAAQVFVNWLLTKDGQTLLAQGLGSPSGRTDVPAGDISPIFVAQPGEKLFMESEEIIFAQGAMRDMAREIIQEAGG